MNLIKKQAGYGIVGCVVFLALLIIVATKPQANEPKETILPNGQRLILPEEVKQGLRDKINKEAELKYQEELVQYQQELDGIQCKYNYQACSGTGFH